MRLKLISKLAVEGFLREMSAIKLCPSCGKSMAANHYWYKGGWKCKGVSKAPTVGTVGTAPVLSPAASPTPLEPSTPVAPPTASAPPTKRVTKAPTAASSNPDLHGKIKKWLDDHKIKGYTIAPDMSVSVIGSVNLMNTGWKKLPVKFTSVKQDFNCINGHLETFENFPDQIGGSLHCQMNNFSSLDHFPTDVGGSIVIHDNPITSLNGLPESINGNLMVGHCKLTTLEGMPSHIAGSIEIHDNLELTSLRGLPKDTMKLRPLGRLPKLISLEGMPSDIHGNFQLSDATSLQSLNGMGEIRGDFKIIGASNLTSLEGMNLVSGEITLDFGATGKMGSLVGLTRPYKKLSIEGNYGSFEGMPTEINDAYLAMPSNRSFEHISPTVHGMLMLADCAADDSTGISLLGIHKHIKVVEGALEVGFVVSNGGLGILRIKKLTSVQFNRTLTETNHLGEVLSKAITNGTDILEVQEQLLDAGLDKYARL